MQYVALLIGNFDAPWTLVGFTKLNAAECGPAGWLEKQSLFCAEFILVIPSLINIHLFGYGIE